MARSAWYPMTYRTSPLPTPVAEAHQLRHENTLARDYAVRSELFAELQECLAQSSVAAPAALARWQKWAGDRRAAVTSTLGNVPVAVVAGAERRLPVRSEATAVVRRYSLTLAGSSDTARRDAAVLEVVAGARAKAETALLVLPELEPGLGGGRRGSAEPWQGLKEAGAALVLADWPALESAYNASCKAMLVSGTSFPALFLAEVEAIAAWLHDERGYSKVVVAAEAEACPLALLAAAVLPNVDGCALSRPLADSLWPLDTMMILPEARRTMDAAVLAALVPPRGLLLLGQAHAAAGAEEWLYAAQAAAALHDPSSRGAAGRAVVGCATGQAETVAAWLEAVTVGDSTVAGPPPLAPETEFPAVVRARAATTPRDRFLRILGGTPERSPLSSWSEPMEHTDLRMERVFYRSEPDVVVPGVFVAPPGGRGPYPVVLALPGSSSTDVDVALPWGLPLLQRGMAIFAVDVKASRFGHRITENAPEAIERGTSALAEMTWDLVRALDYLETRPDVDASRIGCFGISIGGTQTWLLAAADERVKVAAPVVGVASYRSIIAGIRDDSIDSTFMSCLDSHTIYYFPPGLLRLGDQADFLSLIAPRPLLVLGMSADNCFPRAGVVETAEALRRMYGAAGAGDRFDYYIDEGPHSYPVPLQERVWGWMQRWL